MYQQTQLIIEDYIETGVMPGVNYSFFINGRWENFSKGYAQVLPKKEPLVRDMLFDVASLTKVICTTTILLKLLEKKAIALDDSLQKYLPGFKDSKVSVRHLLTHTSDISGYIKNRNQLSADELKKELLRLPSGPNLGKHLQYTDTGFLLLGFMLEKIFHKPVQDIFMEQVLFPLGMSSSTFQPSDSSGCVPTEYEEKKGVLRGIVHDPKARILKEHCGSAGLFTNISDIQKFVQLFFQKGKLLSGEQFLQSQTLLHLLEDQTPTGLLRRSLGWDLKFDLQDQHPILFHTGYTGTFLFIDLLNSEAFIFLSNRIHPFDRRDFYLKKRDALINCYLKEKMTRKN